MLSSAGSILSSEGSVNNRKRSLRPRNRASTTLILNDEDSESNEDNSDYSVEEHENKVSRKSKRQKRASPKSQTDTIARNTSPEFSEIESKIANCTIIITFLLT